MAMEMISAHNGFIRGINALLLQGPNVSQPSDIADILFYGETWEAMISHHHDVEERILFPGMQEFTGKKDIMADNIEQHAAFHGRLQAFGKYCRETKPEQWKWAEMKAIIDGFMPTLYEHLTAEIPSLLALREYDDAGLQKVWGGVEA